MREGEKRKKVRMKHMHEKRKKERMFEREEKRLELQVLSCLRHVPQRGRCVIVLPSEF